jgi:tetratricopeptide (TPR) repeat protein
MNSGPIQRRVGLIKDAIASANVAEAIFRTYLPKNTRTWGAHLRHRGAAWIAARNGAMAVADLTEARDVISKSLGPMNGTTLSIRTNLALALAYAGRLTEAHNESEAMVAAYRGKDPEEILPFALHVSGIVARLDGRYKTALALQQEVLSTTSPTDPLVEQIRLRVLIELGLDQLELAKHAEALATLTDASILVEKLQRVASPMRAEIWLGLGRVHLAMGRPGQARALFEQADTFWRDFDPNSRWAGEAAFWLARADDALGQRADARREFTRAIDLLANSPITLDRKLIAAARRH